MEVWISENAARVRPGLRYIGERIDKHTGELKPPIVLNKWNRIRAKRIDTATGEVVTGLPDPDAKPKTRSECRKFTVGSARRLKFNSLDFNPHWLLTLTYDKIPDVRKCYEDLNRYLTWLRSIGVKKYLWVAEMQSRGALHFHVIIPWGKYGRVLWAWSGIKSGDSWHSRPAACMAWGRCAHLSVKSWLSCGRIERIRAAEGGRAYVRKYLSKGSEQQWNGRRWGSHRVNRYTTNCGTLVRTFQKITGKGKRDFIFGRETNPVEFAKLEQLVKLFTGEQQCGKSSALP